MVLQHAMPAVLSRDVLYIGSAVPLETSEGLEAVQQPLRSRYPMDRDENVQGILSTISILPSGIELRYKNDASHVVLFPFSSLTMCAAVRCVRDEMIPRFVSLSSPEAGGLNSHQPAVFTMITRRTKGRQVLECHGFITTSPKDAMDLVQSTSDLDRRSKHGTLETVMTGTSTSDVRNNSFYAETSSLQEFPIQLFPGEPMSPNTAPAFYKEPPRDGYFYPTRQELVKKFSLHKFTKNAGADSTLSVTPSGLDHFEKRPGYASSHYSLKSAPPQPRQPVFVPFRPVYPQPISTLGRPVFVAPPPPPPPPMFAYPRLRFFSPPPPALRVQPVPMFVPTPVPSVYEETHAKTRINRKISSRSSSVSSIPDSPRFSSRTYERAHLNHLHDDSSESLSRPLTPPTDYDVSQVPRLSRKDEFYLRHNLTRDLPKSPRLVPAGGYYMIPPYYNLTSGAFLDRPRSLPAHVDKVNMKTKKTKKTKTKKKEKKKVSKKSDESTDSVGYMSAPNVDGKQPRDFRRLENQFQHERAFSQSLAEETRRSLRGDSAYNAYSLNNTAQNNENEFPPTMY